MNKQPELLPVSHYEILGISPDADQQLILQKYRLLNRFWHADNASKWITPNSESDLEGCKKIHLQIQVAYKVLSNERDRALYNDSLALPLFTNQDHEFRSTWNFMISKYSHKILALRILPLSTEPTKYQPQWGGGIIPKHLLADLFRWVNRNDRGRLPTVSIETNVLIMHCDLQRYCDFVNEQIKLFTELTTANTLTIVKLKEHWQFSDALLRILVNFRLYPSIKQKDSSWLRSFLLTVDDPTQNDYLKNPYLRDLVILLLTYKDRKTPLDLLGLQSHPVTKAAKLIPENINDFTKLHDPSAIFLYADSAPQSHAIQASCEVAFATIIKEKLSDQECKNIVVQLRQLLYIKPEYTIAFIRKCLTSMQPGLTIDTSSLYSQASCFIRLPSVKMRKFVLSNDKRSPVFLSNLVAVNIEYFDVGFWDDLSTQLSAMEVDEIKSYLAAMINPLHLAGSERCAFQWEFYYQRFIELWREILYLPVQVIKAKIKEVAENCFSDDLVIHSHVLRLLLNPRMKHITLEKINRIFEEKPTHYHNDREENNVEIFSIFLDDECIDYLFDPENLMDPVNKYSIVVQMEHLNSKGLYQQLMLLQTLCECGLTFLLTRKFIDCQDLFRLPKDKYRIFLQMASELPAEFLSRDKISQLLECSKTADPLSVYSQFLTLNGITKFSRYELIQLVLLPNSKSVIKSTACALLIKRIGLQNFMIVGNKELNYLSLLSYLVAVEQKANEKLPALLDLIATAFQNNQVERLPELVNGYLIGTRPVSSKQNDSSAVGEKRAVPTNPNDERLAKLYRKAQKDPQLADRLFEIDVSDSSDTASATSGRGLG